MTLLGKQICKHATPLRKLHMAQISIIDKKHYINKRTVEILFCLIFDSENSSNSTYPPNCIRTHFHIKKNRFRNVFAKCVFKDAILFNGSKWKVKAVRQANYILLVFQLLLNLKYLYMYLSFFIRHMITEKMCLLLSGQNTKMSYM